MIISIYGIPRSGKDTFINEILKKVNAIHIKGSEVLNRISYTIYNDKFKNLNTNQQNDVRLLFANEVKELSPSYNIVIVDGHYSFPNNHSFSSVFTEADLNLYDTFFYLKRTGEEIARNFNLGDKKEYSEYLLDKNKAEEWMQYEITQLQSIVEKVDKDLIVLDSSIDSIDFVCNYKSTSMEIANRISKEISQLPKKRIIITDLDRTISINDLTNDFIEREEIDPLLPKKIFSGDYYTQFQFWKFHTLLRRSLSYDESIRYAVNKIQLNKDLILDVLSKKNIATSVIGITTGIADAWNVINQRVGLMDKIYGYNGEIIVTPLVKKLVVKNLTKEFEVIAIGDSIVDLEMLMNANKGYIISMTKLDQRVIKAYEENKIKTPLFQLPYSIFKYDFFKEDCLRW